MRKVTPERKNNAKENFITVSAIYGKLKKRMVLAQNSTAKDAISQMGAHPEIVLVRRKGEIIPHEEPLKNGDKLELLRVVTGG